MKRFVVGKEQFPMFFEPAVGEVFEYVHDGITTLLQVEEKKNGFCGGCWIKEFMTDRIIAEQKLSTELSEKYCLNCGSGREDRKSVIFKCHHQ